MVLSGLGEGGGSGVAHGCIVNNAVVDSGLLSYEVCCFGEWDL